MGRPRGCPPGDNRDPQLDLRRDDSADSRANRVRRLVCRGPSGSQPRPVRAFVPRGPGGSDPEGLKYSPARNENPMSREYDELLTRAQAGLQKISTKSSLNRLELPEPQVIWVGKKTILRNYSEFPKLFRRDPDRVLMYLAKELATGGLDRRREGHLHREEGQGFVHAALPEVYVGQRDLSGLRQPGHTHRDGQQAPLQGLRGVRGTLISQGKLT